MHWFDIITISVIGIAIIWSFIKGFIRVVFTGVLAFAISIIAATKVYPWIYRVISPVAPNPTLGVYLSIILPFFAFIVILRFIGLRISKIPRLAEVNWLNRFLAIPIGFFTGILISSLVCIGIRAFPEGKSALKGSYLAPSLVRSFENLKEQMRTDMSGKKRLTGKN